MGFLQLGRRIFTTRMSDFYYSDIVFLLLGCRIFTTRMWHFCNLHGCRIFTTRMSDFTTWMPDFYNSNGTCKIRRLHYYASRALSCMLIYVIFGCSSETQRSWTHVRRNGKLLTGFIHSPFTKTKNVKKPDRLQRSRPITCTIWREHPPPRVRRRGEAANTTMHFLVNTV